MSETPFLLLVCDDLFFGSRIGDAASRAGVRLVTQSAAPLDGLEDPACRGVILDLSHQRLSPDDVAAAATSRPELRKLAFGPHVRTELFAAATAAGFETVTRGQMNRSAGDILEKLVSGRTAE